MISSILLDGTQFFRIQLELLMPKGRDSIRTKVVLVELYGYSHKSLVGALCLRGITLGKGTLHTYPSLIEGSNTPFQSAWP